MDKGIMILIVWLVFSMIMIVVAPGLAMWFFNKLN